MSEIADQGRQQFSVSTRYGLLFHRELLQALWTSHGGWADVDETPSQAVVRETFEEFGFETQVVKLLSSYSFE